VQQILTVGRQQENVKAPVEVHLIVKEVLRLIANVLPTTVEVKRWIDPEAGTVLADPSQLHQVLMNLCTNAAHAMQGQSRGELEVHLEPCILGDEEAQLLGGLQPGEYVRLRVADNGHGMDTETMSRIFDPYFTTKKQSEGTGLGLAVVRGIVTSHGGAIQVESELGKGSNFQVYLPRLSSPKIQAEAARELHWPGNERVLLVDDETQLVSVVRSMLQRLGYQVTAVSSSPEALKIFLARPFDFDLVLTDQTMPDICGTGLAEEILACRPGMPIVLCTGYSDQVNHDKARQLGIREFLEKPLTLGTLSAALRRALGKENGQKEI
jgi:CheY-like chemotaxis protein